MSQTKVQSGFVEDNSVTAAKIADSNVTTAKIADSNVTTAKIAAGAVTITKLDSTVSGALVPIGGIIMWSGSVATIPSSWALCNGANGTPNLQDRFLVGAGSGYSVGATGGNADATLVSHSHTGTTGGHSADHSHSISDPGHDHDWGYLDGQIGGGSRAGSSATFFTATRRVQRNTTGITGTNGTSNNHTHDFTTSTQGSSATNANLPPYYALAFIMRVS
jgi:hypothetical protein